MRILQLCIFCSFIFSFGKSQGQTLPAHNVFSVKGEITGRDTGVVILWYKDKDNQVLADTTRLHKGKFTFRGTTNKVCEALLWVDPSKRDFDNVSMIRFLLEPKTILILGKKDQEAKSVIKGSTSETEKQKWDLEKWEQLKAIMSYRGKIDSLYRIDKSGRDVTFQQQVSTWADKLDSVNKVVVARDVQYMKSHSNSYLSAYLLSRHVRKLSIDSIQWLFSSLSGDVRKSSVGHDVLSYVYPKTDDNDFRKANPLINARFDERLRNIQSVHDLSLSDTSGSKVDLGLFKGKLLVLDFWTSTCGPCIKNIPALNGLMQTYNPDDIQFISISLDKDAGEWKRSIIKYHFNGLHLSDLQGFNGLLPVYGKVLWVPRYIIVDATGKIINYDAPHPSEAAFKKLLDQLLDRKRPGGVSNATRS